MEKKSSSAFRTIGEVADELSLPAHVLRFWETKFPQIKPHKRRGGHRYYRPQDVDTLYQIKALLHEKGLTIKGAQKLLSSSSRKKESEQDDNQENLFSSPEDEQSITDNRQKLRKVYDELSEVRNLLNENS